MLIGNMNVLFGTPGLRFAVGALAVSIGNDLVVSVAEDPLTFLAFSRIIKRYAIADRTGYELNLQEGIFGDPLLINSYQLRFIKFLFDTALLLNSFLHYKYLLYRDQR
jgi:hypothetical protein